MFIETDTLVLDIWLINWLIDFNGVSIRLGLLHAENWESHLSLVLDSVSELQSFSDMHFLTNAPGEMHESTYPSIYWLNSTITVPLQGWIWY